MKNLFVCVVGGVVSVDIVVFDYDCEFVFYLVVLGLGDIFFW